VTNVNMDALMCVYRAAAGIYLYDNYLEGKIPRSLLTLPRLCGVYLFSNSLEG
jgi:hypothetical protein